MAGIVRGGSPGVDGHQAIAAAVQSGWFPAVAIGPAIGPAIGRNDRS